MAESMTETIWEAADKAFKRPEVFKAWPMICVKWEHALWRWNDQFGPLNQAQRDYFVELIVSALAWAGSQAPERRYASYQASVMAKLNHDRVVRGFESRRSAQVDLSDDHALAGFGLPEVPE